MSKILTAMRVFVISLTFFFASFSYATAAVDWYIPPSGSLPRVTTAEKAQAFIDNGANVNELFGGNPSLYYAVDHNRVEVARVLLKSGADVNEVTYWMSETSYLHMARSEKMIKLLLEYGAELRSGVLASVWSNLYDENILHEKGRVPYTEARRMRKALKQAGAGFKNRIKNKCARVLSKMN